MNWSRGCLDFSGLVGLGGLGGYSKLKRSGLVKFKAERDWANRLG